MLPFHINRIPKAVNVRTWKYLIIKTALKTTIQLKNHKHVSIKTRKEEQSGYAKWNIKCLHLWGEDTNRGRQQTLLGREHQSFGGITKKAPSQVATHLASEGRGAWSRASEDDWNGQVGSFLINSFCLYNTN